MRTHRLDGVDTLRGDEVQVRGRVFEFGGGEADVGPLHPHQAFVLQRIEAVAPLQRSGIVHFPTGAGKTRVGIEVMARALRAEPGHRFLWATHSKNLLAQSMIRLAEMSPSFAPGTRFAWPSSASDVETAGDVHITFLTRQGLAGALQAAAQSAAHSWRRHLAGGLPLTLIYDECHQLGAEQLQEALGAFYRALEAPGPNLRWRVIGLSATPVPTRREAHRLLAQRVFPKVDPVTGFDWPFYVFHRVTNARLVDEGILCRPTDFFDRRGTFDIPRELLASVVGSHHLEAPGPAASPMVVQRYARQFNATAMADSRVLAWLADRIGTNIGTLGKTIVFVPSIDAANELAAKLYESFPRLRGSVSAVHTRMHELPLHGAEQGSVEAVLARFRQLGSRPSVLINVDLLTEGFDDPKIQTVVLARLTLSTNRFWQMIGRGTRGSAVGGTRFCYVIDPVKLTRLYDYFSGYQPSFDGAPVELEASEGEDPADLLGDGGDPSLQTGALPPDPGEAPYSVHAQVEAIAARAVAEFLRGELVAEESAVLASRAVSLETRDGELVFAPSTGPFNGAAAAALLLADLSRVEARHAVTLPWLRNSLRCPTDAADFLRQLRLVRAVESGALWTKESFDAKRAELEAALGAPPAQSSPALVTQTSLSGLAPAELFVLEAGVTVAQADGRVVAEEVSSIATALRTMFGRATTADLVERITTTRPGADEVLARTPPGLHGSQAFWNVLVDVAAADGWITIDELRLLKRWAGTLAIPESVVEARLPTLGLPDRPSANAAGSPAPSPPRPAASPSAHVWPWSAPTSPARSLPEEDDVPLCKGKLVNGLPCSARALEGNYGFCGRHRTSGGYVDDTPRCKGKTRDGLTCLSAAAPGNYGFCRRHR